MNNQNHILLSIAIVIAAALASPAVAQNTSVHSAAHPAPSPAHSGSSPTAAQPGGASSSGGQTWTSVDTDGDGAISKQEAQVNAGLAQIFDQADSNADDELTQDEYKTFVTRQQSGADATDSQGD